MRLSAVMPSFLSPNVPAASAFVAPSMPVQSAREPLADATQPTWQYEPTEFDLAQRVRESGEW